MTRLSLTTILLGLCLAVFGCESDDPEATDTDAGAGGAGGGGEAGPAQDYVATGASLEACMPAPSYFPGDEWPECISDSGMYELAGESTPSSAARVVAFEDIGELLWRNTLAASPEAFTNAAAIYGEEGGVGSRVTRRYDSHIEKPADANCRDEDAGEKWPEYCVGPASIEPLILDALAAGAEGTDPAENARRVEAGLLWFYYVSAFKEANSCAGKAKDCDSCWAYYSGGVQPGEDAFGLAGIVQEIEPETHQAVMDAALAVRCWRDIDDAEVSEDPDLHQQALNQLDPALDRALAAVLISRLKTFPDAEGVHKDSQWAFLEVLGPVIDRAARNADATMADELLAMWATPQDLDAARAIEILNTLFPCPY